MIMDSTGIDNHMDKENRNTYELEDHAAVRNLVENASGRWFKNGIDVHDRKGPFAVQRLHHRLFTPSIPDPGFRMKRKEALFAMGSCFARGIENALLGKKFTVLSAATEFDDFELGVAGVTGRGFMNKYSTHSMRHEFEWALDESKAFPQESLVEEEGGVWVDPSTNPTLKRVDLEGTLSRRATISEVVRRVRDCRLVVLTLGLVELWYDREAGIHLNSAPTPHMRRTYPGRYTFQVTGFRENRDNMEAIGSLLARVGRPDQQIVVTTSPVPLMATFTDRDVVVANTYSKSVLRAVAEDFAAAHSHTHYFPSYEIVMNSERQAAWSEDGRHVVPEVVHHIMDLFRSKFVED